MTNEKPRILVADDEARIHDFFIEALKSEPIGDRASEIKTLERELFRTVKPSSPFSGNPGQGYDLDLCTSGSDAVDHVIRSLENDTPYSVVFLDVRMPPGPDGIWAAEKIRSLDRDIEIVIVTAFSDIHPADILKRVPPVHKLLYLQKPCYVLEIRHMAASLTSKWSMERELKRIQEQQERRIETQKSALDEAYQTLERMQKLDALGMFAGAVAHDFNNIMTAIIGHTEIALLDTQAYQGLHARMEYIHKACFKAKDLVNRILTFSRQNEPEFVVLALGGVIMDVIKLIHASTPSNITVQSHVADDAGWILADPTQIHQILMNLFSNAVYAMRQQGGILGIRLGKSGDFRELSGMNLDFDPSPCVVLCVSDTGCGMDVKTMEKMFDPYFTTKGKNEGTGLGLAVIHGIVKKQGGFIHVESKPLEGTQFYVFFKSCSA
ncbi:MAG: hypothetical protein KKD44_20775 [Proteobacteria bacterium]|nr:hypothetical protein [Pseudomonadota bacterium]